MQMFQVRHPAGSNRVEKEIPFAEFHDWLIEQLAEHRSFA